jgi:outer membrane protein OmpA-like peptidoglycan-associated protein
MWKWVFSLVVAGVVIVWAPASRGQSVDQSEPAADVLEDGIERDGRAMLAGIFFDSDKAVVKPESAMALEAIAGYLGSKPGVRFFVVGHTDATGSYEHNLELSAARAGAVVAELTGKHGIPESRLMAVGIGPVAPVATNDTREGRDRNRRVELVKRLD